jgi:hypothetical protein
MAHEPASGFPCPVRLGGQRLARVAAGRPPLKTHVACGAGTSLGGTLKRKGGQAGHVGGSEYDGRYAEAFVASSQVHVDATERNARCETCQKRGWRSVPI